jgi:hypothetical protein
MTQTEIATIPQPSATLRYDEMCRAIAVAYKVDEVKDMVDQATAIEVYAHQSQNIEAERQACEIRMRATRRLGTLLKERDKAKGSPGNQHTGPLPTSEGSKPLADLGISYNQSSRYQKLADVPEDKFEAALTAPGRVTTGGIIAKQTPPKPPAVNAVDDRALWLWGRLKDFEREELLAADPNDLIATMLPHMQETTREYAPRVVEWLQRIKP